VLIDGRPATPSTVMSWNLRAVDECATVYTVLVGVLQESAAVTIHLTYRHAIRLLSPCFGTVRRRG